MGGSGWDSTSGSGADTAGIEGAAGIGVKGSATAVRGSTPIDPLNSDSSLEPNALKGNAGERLSRSDLDRNFMTDINLQQKKN